MKILDLSAGNRGIWFDKAHPCATFVDIRPEVKPDVVADTRALPADIGEGYDLIVFDPPHKNNGQNFGMVRSYGSFTHEEIRATIGETAKEAHRVARDNALMAFKWHEGHIRLSGVLELLAPYWEPLFGHGVTHQQKGTSWVMLRRLDCFNPVPTSRDDALSHLSHVRGAISDAPGASSRAQQPPEQSPSDPPPPPGGNPCA